MYCANSLWQFVVRFFVVLKRKRLLSEVFSCSQYFFYFRSLSLDGIGLWLVFSQLMFDRLCQSFELSGCFVLFVCLIPSRLWWGPLSWRAVVDVSCLPWGSEKKSFSVSFVRLFNDYRLRASCLFSSGRVVLQVDLALMIILTKMLLSYKQMSSAQSKSEQL